MNIKEEFSDLLSNPKFELLKLDTLVKTLYELNMFFETFEKEKWMLFPETQISGIKSLKAEFQKSLDLFRTTQWNGTNELETLRSVKQKIENDLRELQNRILSSNEGRFIDAFLYYRLNQIDISGYKAKVEEKADHLISLFESKRLTVESDSIEYNNLLANTKKRLNDEAEKAIEKAKEYYDEAQNLMRGKLAQKYNGLFENKEKEFEEHVTLWRDRTYIALSVLIVVFIISLICEFTLNSEIGKIGYNFTITKIGLISIIAWLVLFFNKNYNTNKNLAYVYKQKHTMLETYLVFIDTIEDREVKNRVAAEIGKIIFEVVDTGYIKTQADSSPTLVGQIENIMKTVKQ